MTETGRTADLAQEARILRHQLAQRLIAAGHIQSPRWRAAVEAVPRHLFVPDFFTTVDPGNGSHTLYVPVNHHSEAWLNLAYADDSLVTQLDGRITPAEITEPTSGIPTSSATMPSLVVRMWEYLDVRDGDRVLEIGTGTGYSTALGCHHLGDDNVTSIEIDPIVAARARAALDRAGYFPHLVVGDGLAGYPQGAPYDRLIATCALRNVPPAWVEQGSPGAVLVMTLSGWLDATGLAKLTVTGPGTAEGGFVDPEVSFMPARAHAPEFVMIPDLAEDLISERSAMVGPDMFADWGPVRRVIQLAAPNAQYLQLGAEQDMPEHLLVTSDESYVAFHRAPASPSGWAVRQGGREALWDRVEPAILAWHEAGSPPLTAFRITVTPERQLVGFGQGIEWDLPG